MGARCSTQRRSRRSRTFHQPGLRAEGRLRLAAIKRLIHRWDSARSWIGPDCIQPENSSEAFLLERVLISLLGLWFAIQAVLDGLSIFSRWHLYRRFVEDQYPGATGPAIAPQEFAGLITAAVQLAFGLWLVLGSRGIVNAVARLRD